MTKLFIARMINSRSNDKITVKHVRLMKYAIKQGWLTFDKVLNDRFGVFIRDNNL